MSGAWRGWGSVPLELFKSEASSLFSPHHSVVHVWLGVGVPKQTPRLPTKALLLPGTPCYPSHRRLVGITISFTSQEIMVSAGGRLDV